MKDHNITIAPTVEYDPSTQCVGKKQHEFKRRAIKEAQRLPKETRIPFTVYECPHCKKFHVGGVRV